MFGFLSSFTKSEIITDTSGQTSTNVYVEFENPRILIDDYRTYKALADMMRSNTEFDSAVIENMANANTNWQKYIESQERRYESSMDYLTRKTGKTIDEIYKAYEKRRKTRISIAIFGILSVIFAFFTALNDKNKKGGWPAQWALFTLMIFVSALLMMLVDGLLLYTVNSDYHYINTILNLSG